jgi:hypothetical protein
MKHFFIPIAIFIAVFFSSFHVYSQEYNNWLFNGGAILNFDTSPAKIICYNSCVLHSSVFNSLALSDDDGKIILSAYRNESKKNVIVNSKNEIVVSYDGGVENYIVGSKLPQGGYYIAISNILNKRGLRVYKFDEVGNLEKEYHFNHKENYCFFLDFLHVDDYIVLVAYRSGKLETYKLTLEGCFFWKSFDFEIEHFMVLQDGRCLVDHTADCSKIVACSLSGQFVFLNFNKSTGEISILKQIKMKSFMQFAFSKNDYFLIYEDHKIKLYKYDANFYFDFDYPDFVYTFPKEYENNICYYMGLGCDGKLYVYLNNSDFLVLDGIDSGNVTEEIIKSDCNDGLWIRFPRVRNFKDYKLCQAKAFFNNSIVCFGDEGLKINLSGTAPYEVFYTLDGEEKSFKTSEKEFILPNIVGKYKIEKVKDATCEFLPVIDNEAVVYDKLKKIKIIAE